MFRSATFKLTLSYLAILTALCLMFSGAIYQSATNELRYNIYRQTEQLTDRYPNVNFIPALNPEKTYQESRHRIVLSLIYLNMAVLIATGLASYGLARWTLRPIEEAHEQQKRFTADVSHELRTPLTALKMTTEVALMDSGATKSALRKVLESNLADASKLEVLINNLLRLTKLEAAELQQQFAPVKIAGIIEEAIDTVSDQAAVKQIIIDKKLTSKASLIGDRSSLIQLLTIFLDNSIKYSPAKTTITVRSQRDKESVKITITDQGAGIPAVDLPHIFDRFYRADTARTNTSESGFGLGLSIAKMISELHNGQLHIYSQVGKGTTVNLLLPAAKA